MLTNSASFCIDGLLLRYEKWARRVWRGLQFTDFTICGFKERHSSTGDFVKSRCHDIKKIKYKYKMNKKNHTYKIVMAADVMATVLG